MLKQEGAKLVSVLQASVLHLTLTTIITHGGVLVIFSCKAKAKNNPTSVYESWSLNTDLAPSVAPPKACYSLCNSSVH